VFSAVGFVEDRVVMVQVIPSDDELFDVISKEALIDRATLKRDANLEDLGIASLDVISVLFEVEERYGIMVEAEELADCKTLGDLMDKLKDRAQATASA
jgi:acyl carrier protein